MLIKRATRKSRKKNLPACKNRVCDKESISDFVKKVDFNVTVFKLPRFSIDLGFVGGKRLKILVPPPPFPSPKSKNEFFKQGIHEEQFSVKERFFTISH
jgi:hypothetical protein